MTNHGFLCAMLAAGAAAILAHGGPARADVKLPAILGSGMVLQRDVPVPVWGWADPGETVTVSLAGQQKNAKAGRDGRWSVKLDALKAPGPVTLTVKGKNTIELTDILVGEVWLCSGQSNMDWGMNQIRDPQKELAQANQPTMRLFQAPYKNAGAPLDDCDGKWTPCTSDTLASSGFWGGGFSAVAYFFGRELNRELGVPVGIVKSALGATRIEPWTPPAGFDMVPECADIAQRVRDAGPKLVAAQKKALPDLQAWLPKARQALGKGAPAPEMPAWPKSDLEGSDRPTGLYNAMIHPLAPFAIRGAIWYQGESNREDRTTYTAKMRALIGGWRKVWGQGDFPFYFVQLAPFLYNDGHPDWLPLTWEAQARTLETSNTGMVVITDLVDDLKDIHPKNKRDVGARLAGVALAQTYGRKDAKHAYPMCENMRVEGGKALVKLSGARDGLKSRDGKALTHFQVAGADKKFVAAKAQAKGDTVTVSSDKVKTPVAVRFGWSEDAMPNLVNSDGLPAVPFRTDNW
jgi:sialate O-acetylesterase